jgi:hypothetical protein
MPESVTKSPCWDCHRWLEPHRLEKLTVDLAPTADQQTQIKPILSKALISDQTTQQEKFAVVKDQYSNQRHGGINQPYPSPAATPHAE